jgi:RES domain-containing protein
MLTGAALEAAVRKLPSRPRRGTFLRAVPIEYQRTPLGLPPTMNPNRFNLLGGAAALYLGGDAHVCIAEVQMLATPAVSYGIFAVELDLKAVVDLHDPAVLTALALTLEDVTFNFRSLGPGGRHATQLLGEACAAARCVDGLAFPSAAQPGGEALAVFVDSLAALGSSLTVHRPSGRVWQRLP